MRPWGEMRLALDAALVEGGGTTRQLAQRTGGGVALTMITLRDMVRAGDVKVARMVRVPGVKRPVPFYERACRAQAQDDAEPLTSLIQLWARGSSCMEARP